MNRNKKKPAPKKKQSKGVKDLLERNLKRQLMEMLYSNDKENFFFSIGASKALADLIIKSGKDIIVQVKIF